MNTKDYLAAILKTCDRHAQRLTWSMGEMTNWLPITAERFQSLTEQDVAILELFSNRFGKLQDAMGAKLFPLVLEIAKEPNEFPAFIDKLNRLEKIGAIPSVDEWLQFREIRNQFAHDYPEDSEQNAATINAAFEQATKLLQVLEQVREFAENRTGRI